MVMCMLGYGCPKAADLVVEQSNLVVWVVRHVHAGVRSPDPEAADLVFGHEANIRVVGLDVTHSCLFSAVDLAGLAGQGRFGTFLAQIARFYLQYHRWARAETLPEPFATPAMLPLAPSFFQTPN